MNKLYTVIFLVLFSSLTVSAQQFALYNTGTVYDSFENPSQRSFIPDSSKQIAFNVFIPNFSVNGYLTGNAQQSLKSRLFATPATYDPAALQIGQGKLNHANLNANAYLIMLKMFTSLNGDVEIGFSAQTKLETKGLFTDETIGLLDGPRNFAKDTYDNTFNDHYSYQAYHQLSFSYRERINKQFAFGFKLSALLGVQYESFDVDESHITFDKPNDRADLTLRGHYEQSYTPGVFAARDFLPSTRNPGAAISLGTSFRTDDGVIIQGTMKDLGFIHWSGASETDDFNATRTINGLSTKNREDSIHQEVYNIFRSAKVKQPFTTKTNAKLEGSVSKSYWLDYDKDYKYTPTLVASKELFYTGFTGALVNAVQYQNYVGTLTTSYDDMKLFNLGLQFMVKTPNVEFYIGSEKFLNTGRLALAAMGNNSQITQRGSYTGGELYLGFTFKFGHVIEHPMNASTIPMGEKGFFGRLFNRIFKTNN